MNRGSAMSTRPLLRMVTLLAALAQLSCASAGLTPEPRSQPAERIGLLPEYRVFYDALQGYGDWVLVNPYGYVFRPDENILLWRPYEDGFWAPSDIYGWTWISAEPFGWATYHYGSWFYDKYYGWLWRPGIDWGPAWVSWQLNGDYAGWSPLLNPNAPNADIPGGPWTYAPIGVLGATALSGHIVHAVDLRGQTTAPKPVINMAERGGVRFNRGPSFELVEKSVGTLPRVTIEPVVSAAAPSTPPAHAPAAKGKEKPQPPSPTPVESTRKAAEESARETRGMVESGEQVPERLRIVRAPMGGHHAPAKPGAPSASEGGGEKKGADTDSTAP